MMTNHFCFEAASAFSKNRGSSFLVFLAGPPVIVDAPVFHLEALHFLAGQNPKKCPDDFRRSATFRKLAPALEEAHVGFIDDDGTYGTELEALAYAMWLDPLLFAGLIEWIKRDAQEHIGRLEGDIAYMEGRYTA